MGSHLFDGINDRIEANVAPVTAVPLTMAVWGRMASDAATDALIFLGDKDASDQYFVIYAAGLTAGDPIMATQRNPNDIGAVSTTGYTANTWFSAAAVYSTTSARAAFINGGSKGTQGGAGTPTGVDRLSLGYLARSAATGWLTGRLGYAFVWNIALSDAEVANWHAGNIPQLANLVAMYDLTKDYSATGIVPNLVNPGTYDLAINGATFDSLESPPVTYELSPSETDNFFSFI